jgi:hypothetical protein
MGKKGYQLKGDASSFVTTVYPGTVIELTREKDSYETDDPAEQQELDAAVADPNSGLKNAEKKGKDA